MLFIDIVYAAEEAVHEAATNPVVALGINFKLFIAQLVNFSLVLVVLWKWVYTPLVKKMNERTEKISKGLADASRAAEKLAHAQAEMDRLIGDGKREAHTILSEAKKTAEREQARILEETTQKAATLLAKVKEQIQEEKANMIRDAKKEVGELVVAAMEKILGKVVTEKVDKELIEETLESIKGTLAVIPAQAGIQTKKEK